MTLSEIAALFKCSIVDDVALSGVCIDSRNVVPGNLFVALRGENFDGQDFIDDAVARGAVAVLCSARKPHIKIPQIVAVDPLQALTRIATYNRQKLSCQVVALTGSNGKTTVKEMIAAILPQPSLATTGNLNNHIGVPLCVVHLEARHKYAVFELGANHSGEIAHTVAIVQPQVALINNIAPAHIHGFGSIENIARAKGEIYQGLRAGGIAVVNEDGDYAHFWDDVLQDKKVLRFSLHKPTDIYALDLTFDAENRASFALITPIGRTNVTLLVPGVHNVSNALAAAACAIALGLELPAIVTGLQTFSGVSGRMTYRHGKKNSVVIDDTYNANLSSVLIAIDVLARRPGRRIFVFGDMGELGEWGLLHHAEVGFFAKKLGIDCVMTCGTLSEETSRAFGEHGAHYSSQDELTMALLRQLDARTTVLVKGSRASAMEKVVRQLLFRTRPLD